jgi:hypothetical protein
MSTQMKFFDNVLKGDKYGSNIVNKMGRTAMTFFPQQWVMKKGIATSNERLHSIKLCLKTFNKAGFSLNFIAINRENPRLNNLSFIGLLASERKFFFDIFQWTNNGPTAKTELLMRASKLAKLETSN